MGIKRFPFGATLGYLVTEEHILLARKPVRKGEKVGEGLWNGLGGATKEGETPEECVLRELTEETGYESSREHLEKIALLAMRNCHKNGKRTSVLVDAFLIHRWWGKPKISDEIQELGLFRKPSLPFDAMMPIDRYWLPLALSGHRLLVEGGCAQGFASLDGPVHIKVVAASELSRS